MSASGLRLRPNDTGAEEYVLGSMLQMPRDEVPALDVVEALQPGDFFLLKHGELFKAILRVWQDSRWADTRLVAKELERDKKLHMFPNGDNDLNMLSNGVDSVYYAGAYAKRVAEMADRRRIIAASEEAGTMALDEQQPIEQIRNLAGDMMIDACVNRVDHNNVTALETTEKLYYKLRDGYKRGVLTGFRDLDRHFRNGLVPGQYWILAGRPAMGKSALALRIARNVASGKTTPDGEPGVVLYFTFEMSDEDNQIRLVSEAMNTPINDVYEINPKHEKWEKFRQVCDEVGYLPIVYNERACTIPAMRAAYKRCKMDHKRCDLVVVDREGLVEVNGAYAGEDNALLTRVSNSLLQLSKDVPVLALAQLNRKVEDRANKEPKLADLRMSGSLEQDATAVLMIYREHYYTNEDNVKNSAKVFVRKNRQGSTGMVELFFQPELTAFYDMEWYQQEQ